jgi:hypothetical protein
MKVEELFNRFPRFNSISKCPVKWIPHHVLGYQDDDPMPHRWATLNIEMDEEAKVHWAETVDTSLPSIHDFREPWALWWKDKLSARYISRIHLPPHIAGCGRNSLPSSKETGRETGDQFRHCVSRMSAASASAKSVSTTDTRSSNG